MRIADRVFFERIRDYLGTYLLKVRVRSDGTINAYRAIINEYIDFLAETNKVPLAKICSTMVTAVSLKEYLEWLVDVKGCAPTTRNQRLSCIRSLCSYLASEDVTFMAEYAKMKELSKLPVDTDSRFTWLTLEQVRLILSLPDTSDKYGLRDLAYLTLLYDSGARNGELLGLKVKDLSMDAQWSLRVLGKGGKIRNIPISEEATEILSLYLNVFHSPLNKERFLFYTVRCGIESAMSPDNTARIMGKYEASARENFPELPHLHPHLWRHSRSMHLYKAGMPLALLSEWLGHSQTETTMIYAHADTEMKRKAIESATQGECPIVEAQDAIYDDDETIRLLYGLR